MKKLSIITINKNNFSDVWRTLSSLQPLAANDQIELIGVDGNSTDGSLEIMRGFYGASLYLDCGKGIYNAMNFGASRSTGQLLMWINSGDELYAEVLLKALDNIEPMGEIYSFSIEIRAQEGRYIRTWEPSLADLPDLTLPHPGLLVPRGVFKELGGYDDVYRASADRDFVLKCFLQRKPFVLSKMIVAKFYIGGISSTNISYLEDQEINLAHGLIGEIRYFFRIARFRITNMFKRPSSPK